MSFSEKSLSMQEFLESMFGTGTAIQNKKCVICGKDANTFRDALSKKEYGISGLCQECQDSVFGKGVE
jgi:uncharacterized CHY-type Zn-finger protein